MERWSLETPIHFATRKATRSQRNSGIIRPLARSRELPDTKNAGYRLKIRPTLKAPPTIAKHSNSSELLPHTDPGLPCQHSASFENSSTGIKSALSKLLKFERWSRVVHLRHPTISRQERRHTPRENLGPSAPFAGHLSQLVHEMPHN